MPKVFDLIIRLNIENHLKNMLTKIKKTSLVPKVILTLS